MSKSKIKIMACFTALALSSACSDSKSETAPEFSVAESAPADSTGTNGTMNLNFASLKSMGLRLANATTLAIGTDIELTYAKFNLAKIRVKVLKEQSTDEKTLETMEKDEEKVSSKEAEVETGDDGASLVKKSEEETRAERAAKIKAKAAELDSKEKNAIKKESARDKATKFTGPFVFDAIAGKIEGDAPETKLIDGSYRRIEFQMKRNFSAAEGEAILGNVFAIRGTVLKAGVKVPFAIDWHVALNFRLSGEGAITVAPGIDNAMLIDFDLSKWFEGIDLKAATVDSDGTIYISKRSNRDLMRKLHHNIKVNSHFGKDLDGDKVLDTNEKAGAGEDVADAEVE
ncbi:MAG: hypothetical protein H7318_20160 [Oligoflexus sp.]|nr:hypothetical protein [Oligoflexus sp.]